MTVSLAGIDAPGITIIKSGPGQPYAQRAKAYLAELLLNALVDIKAYGQDINDHIVGVIFLGGKNINLEMVRAGLAEVCRGKPPNGLNLGPYLKVEAEARKAKRGIWSLGEK
jgi:micrococcal nuclease